MESEDGTGGRRPLLGDAGMSPRLFHLIAVLRVASVTRFFYFKMGKSGICRFPYAIIIL